ncbi:apoptosis regulatory protein Siva isoform X3 [Dendropsophus ebraccatus]|uniref:apoptosis regulatory protein Siva isoform X3 n=1 Tax=Dendropsophus ebraccatus TaxID=150705 RepID=UPI0038311FD3
MTKRSYPFDSLAPPQLKTHVGQKELIQGVCGDSLKREIFERTKKLLFNGAKAIMGNQGNQNKTSNPEVETPVHELLTGQTTIGQDGKLHKSSRTSAQPVEGSRACSSCVRSVGEKEACKQCERYICRNCSKSCSCCSAVTCPNCTVLVRYSGCLYLPHGTGRHRESNDEGSSSSEAENSRCSIISSRNHFRLRQTFVKLLLWSYKHSL